MNIIASRAGVLILGMACLGGCTQGERPLEEVAPQLKREAEGPGGVPTGTGAAELTARAAAIDVERELHYVDGGGDATKRMSVTRHDPTRVGAWTVVRRVEGGAAPGEQESEYESAGGAVTMARTRDEHEKVITEFTPALVLAPASMRVGETVKQELRMTVRPRANPERIQTQGDATHEITYVGNETVTVPAGRFAAARVRSVLRATLGPAVVENTTESWHAAGVGVVAERRVQRVTAMGLPIRNSDEAWVLERK